MVLEFQVYEGAIECRLYNRCGWVLAALIERPLTECRSLCSGKGWADSNLKCNTSNPGAKMHNPSRSSHYSQRQPEDRVTIASLK